MLGHCDVCRTVHEAPHVPIAEAATVSMASGSIISSGRIISGRLRSLARDGRLFDVLPLNPAALKNSQGAREAFCSVRIGVFGQPKSIRTGEGGEWENAVWAALRPGHRIKLQFQVVGAHPVDSRAP